MREIEEYDEIEGDDRIEPKSIEEDEEYIVITTKHLFDFFFLLFSLIILICYYTVPIFKEFCLQNYAYILSNYDLYYLSIIFILTPYILYFIGIIARIIRKFWVSYEITSIRVMLKIIRINFSIFGWMSVIICIFFHYPFLSLQVLLGSLITLILFNIFLIDYNQIRIDEKEYTKVIQKKNMPQISLWQIIAFAVILIILVSLFNENFKIWFMQYYSIIEGDLFLHIIFWISFTFTFIWFIISFLLVSLLSIIQKYRDKLEIIFGILIFICVIYVITKLIIFNIPDFAPEPYPTLTGLGISIGSTLIQRNSKRIVEWSKNRKKRKSEEDGL